MAPKPWAPRESMLQGAPVIWTNKSPTMDQDRPKLGPTQAQRGPNMTPKRRVPLGLVSRPKGTRRSWPKMAQHWPHIALHKAENYFPTEKFSVEKSLSR